MPDGSLPGEPGAEDAPASLSAPDLSGAAFVTVACTLRSGSNLLCEVLRQNGFGDPKEWFQPAAGLEPGTTQRSGTDAALLERQTGDFLAAHRSPGWRGVKFDWHQFQRLRDLAPNADAADAVLRAVEGGHWIYLARRDLAAQAVSLYAAQLTDAWMGEETADYDRLPEDFDAIHERFAAITADMFAWDEFFRAGRASPVRVFHEDLVGGSPGSWLDLVRVLDPGFDAARLNLAALRRPPREHPRIRALKHGFREQLLAGRRPRSLLTLLEEIGGTVARLQRRPSRDGVIGRFVDDRLTTPGGFTLRKLDLRRDPRIAGPARVVEQSHFLDRLALRLDPGALCEFSAVGRRIMLEFYTHAWSGIAEVRLGDTIEPVDLFSERPGTRHYIRDMPRGFAGTVTVRCAGARSRLSDGSEVWLQRAFILADGDDLAPATAAADPGA